jgi:hypothetical protein
MRKRERERGEREREQGAAGRSTNKKKIPILFFLI